MQIVVSAWTIAEVVRCGHYATTTMNQEVSVLKWLRYTHFTLLYPVGAFGEVVILASLIWADGRVNSTFGIMLPQKRHPVENVTLIPMDIGIRMTYQKCFLGRGPQGQKWISTIRKKV